MLIESRVNGLFMVGDDTARNRVLLIRTCGHFETYYAQSQQLVNQSTLNKIIVDL